MLDNNMLEQIRNYFLKLENQIFIYHDKTADILSFVSQIQECAPGLIQLFEIENKDIECRKGSFVCESSATGSTIVWSGIPMGHEFSSFILSILQLGGVRPKIDEDQYLKIKSIETALVFETFYSQSCQNCPEVVQALNAMAAINPFIVHHAIDGANYAEEVEQKSILSVPQVFLNGKSWSQGRIGINKILSLLSVEDPAVKDKSSSASKNYEVLIVGAGPAGAAASIYMARKGIKTALAAHRLGGQVADTAGIENYPSISSIHGLELSSNLEQHIKNHDLDLFINDVPTETRLYKNQENKFVFEFGTSVLQSDSVILATGARWKTLNVPGEEEYKNRGVAYCPHCDGPLFRGKRVVIAGGGNSGVEAAIDLAGLAREVVLVEYNASLKADRVLQEKLKSYSNVKVLLKTKINRIEGDGLKVTKIILENLNSGQSQECMTDGIFVQIGLLPNTEWLDNSIYKNAYGEVVIDEKCKTSMEGLFAAGDMTSVPYKQIVIAAGEGAKAALSCFDYLIRNK